MLLNRCVSVKATPEKRYLNLNEAAQQWGTSPKTLRRLCLDGKIEGAFYSGSDGKRGRWFIPNPEGGAE